MVQGHNPGLIKLYSVEHNWKLYKQLIGSVPERCGERKVLQSIFSDSRDQTHLAARDLRNLAKFNCRTQLRNPNWQEAHHLAIYKV